MKKNVGRFDTILRLVGVGVIAVLLLTKTTEGTFGIILGVAAIVLLLTGLAGVCPLYSVLKLSSRKQTPAG